MEKNYLNQAIGYNLRGMAGSSAPTPEGLNAKIAMQAKMHLETRLSQPEALSELAQTNQSLSDQIDKLEVEFAGLCARLRPILKLDQPEANCEAGGLTAPWYAASEIGKQNLGHAQRLSEMTGKMQELLYLLAV